MFLMAILLIFSLLLTVTVHTTCFPGWNSGNRL
jgi:hypothetical protein